MIAFTGSALIGFFLSAFVAVAWESYAQITIECFSPKFWICYIPTSFLLFIVFLILIRIFSKQKTDYQNDIIDDFIQTNN